MPLRVRSGAHQRSPRWSGTYRRQYAYCSRQSRWSTCAFRRCGARRLVRHRRSHGRCASGWGASSQSGCFRNNLSRYSWPVGHRCWSSYAASSSSGTFHKNGFSTQPSYFQSRRPVGSLRRASRSTHQRRYCSRWCSSFTCATPAHAPHYGGHTLVCIGCATTGRWSYSSPRVGRVHSNWSGRGRRYRWRRWSDAVHSCLYSCRPTASTWKSYQPWCAS